MTLWAQWPPRTRDPRSERRLSGTRHSGQMRELIRGSPRRVKRWDWRAQRFSPVGVRLVENPAVNTAGTVQEIPAVNTAGTVPEIPAELEGFEEHALRSRKQPWPQPRLVGRESAHNRRAFRPWRGPCDIPGNIQGKHRLGSTQDGRLNYGQSLPPLRECGNKNRGYGRSPRHSRARYNFETRT